MPSTNDDDLNWKASVKLGILWIYDIKNIKIDR